MNWFLYFSLTIICFSFLSSLRIFALKPSYSSPAFAQESYTLLRAFSFFLMFTFIGEAFGIAWPRVLYHYTSFTRSNQWFYTLFHFVTYLFYLWFFSKIFLSTRIKKTIRIFFPVYILTAVLNYFFVQGPSQLNTFSDLLACFLILFLSIAYYYQLIHTNEYVPLREQPFFWISTGLLIYHLGSMMGLFLINIMNVISEQKALNILFVVQISAVLMYVNYFIAFLCMKKT